MKHKPLREHFEHSTDMGDVLATFDYIEALEKYIDFLEGQQMAGFIEKAKKFIDSQEK